MHQMNSEKQCYYIKAYFIDTEYYIKPYFIDTEHYIKPYFI
jgi:hypothetical protein